MLAYMETAFHSYKSARRRKPKGPIQNANHVHPLVMDSTMSANLSELIDNTDCMTSFVWFLHMFIPESVY